MRDDWAETTLGETIKWGSGGTPKSNTSEYYNGDIPWLIIGDLNDGDVRSSEKNITKLGLKNSSAKLVQPDSVLVAMYGSIGKLGINKVEVTTNQAIAFTRNLPKQIYNKYLFHYLFFCRPKLHERGKGGTQKNISQTVLKQFPFLLAPLPEQRAIVAKIEGLFSDLDKGIADLKTAQAQLKIYRQAVLKKAFEGEWAEKKFGDVAEIKRGKSKHRPRNDKQLFGGEYPFIQTGDVKAANGQVINKYSQTYSDLGLAQSKLWPKGTLCLTIAANIADTAFLGFDACFPDSVVGVLPDSKLLYDKFINYYICMLKAKIDSEASAAAQKNINVRILEAMMIPVPSLEE